MKVLVTALGLFAASLTLSDRLPTRIETFHSNAYLVSNGDHITLTWRVKGYGNRVFLDGQPVPSDDARDYAMAGPRTFTLTARGALGGEEKQITINTSSSAAASAPSESTPGDNKTDGSVTTPPVSPDGSSQPQTASLEQPLDATPRVPSVGTTATLEIETTPGSEVNIDGSDKGNTDLQGHLVMPDLAPGSHSVSVTKPGYGPESRSITVEAGGHTSLLVQLNAVAELEHGEMIRAQGLLDAGDAAGARSIANKLLAIDHENTEAKGLIPQTFWQEGNYTRFIETAMDALQHASPVTVTLMHEDNHQGRYIHPITLSLSPSGVVYDPQVWKGNACILQKGLLQVERTRIERKVYKGVDGSKYEEVFLQLNLRPSNSASFRSLSLWCMGSRVIKRQVIKGKFLGLVLNSDLIISPYSAATAFESLLTVMHGIPSHTG